jgi:transposase-like protein
MIPHLFYYQLLVLGLLWLFVMLSLAWPSSNGPQESRPATPIMSRRQHGKKPQPFTGLTHKPPCALCDQEATPPKLPPPLPPAPMPQPTRRPRAIDTSQHFCPHAGCRYRGWLGLGNLRANGHPNGGPWRQFHCRACKGYFPEHHGTIFHNKRMAVELIVHMLACLAEGLGIRATARVFEVEPNTVLHWLVEAAEQLQAFSCKRSRGKLV